MHYNKRNWNLRNITNTNNLKIFKISVDINFLMCYSFRVILVNVGKNNMRIGLYYTKFGFYFARLRIERGHTFNLTKKPKVSRYFFIGFNGAIPLK